MPEATGYNVVGPWSQEASFTTENTVAASLVSPADATDDLPLTTSLVWTGGTATVEVARDKDFTQIVKREAAAESPLSVTLPELLSTYYWRVKIAQGACESLWASRRFRTGSCLTGTPSLGHVSLATSIDRTEASPAFHAMTAAAYPRLVSYLSVYPTSADLSVQTHGDQAAGQEPEMLHTNASPSAAAGALSQVNRSGSSAAKSHTQALVELAQATDWSPTTPAAHVFVLFADGEDGSSDVYDTLRALLQTERVLLFVLTTRPGATALARYAQLVAAAPMGRVYDLTNQATDAAYVASIVEDIGDDIMTFLCQEISSPPPGALTLGLPATGETCVQAPLRFTWAGAADAASYELQISSRSDFAAGVTTRKTNLLYSDESSLPTAGADGKVYWRVRAISAQGKTGPWTTAGIFTPFDATTCAPPARAEFDPPRAGEPCRTWANRSIVISWKAVPGAKGYELMISMLPDFSDVGAPRNMANYLSIHLSGDVLTGFIKTHGTYYLKVRAVNAFGPGPWSDVDTFCVLPAPEALAWTSTADVLCAEGATKVAWNPFAGAVNYEIQVAETPTFGGTPNIKTTTQTEVQLSVLGLGTPLDGKTYYLRVRAVDAGGAQGPWSTGRKVEIWSDCKCGTPAKVVLTLMAGQPCSAPGQRTFTLKWNADPCAISYQYEVAKDRDFTDFVVQHWTNQWTQEATVTVPEDNRTYYWRVRARNASQTLGPWSDADHFCVGAPPAPCNQTTNSGGHGVTSTNHALGSKAGQVVITYDMYGVKDSLEVWYNGQKKVETPGLVSGKGSVEFYYPGVAGGKPDFCTVIVRGPQSGTAWNYQVNCPDPDLI